MHLFDPELALGPLGLIVKCLCPEDRQAAAGIRLYMLFCQSAGRGAPQRANRSCPPHCRAQLALTCRAGRAAALAAPVEEKLELSSG